MGYFERFVLRGGELPILGSVQVEEGGMMMKCSGFGIGRI